MELPLTVYRNIMLLEKQKLKKFLSAKKGLKLLTLLTPRALR